MSNDSNKIEDLTETLEISENLSLVGESLQGLYQASRVVDTTAVKDTVTADIKADNTPPPPPPPSDNTED